MNNKNPKVILVHDWLNGMRGGEKVLELFCEMFPEAPIYTLHSQKEKLSPLLKEKEIKNSFIQHIPFKNKFYRYFLPLFPWAIESFKIPKDTDIVISLNHCSAKGIKTPKHTLHLCYCFTPARYAWDLFDDYFSEKSALFKALIKPMMNYFRNWDLKSSARPTHFIGISKHISAKIKKFYNRDSYMVFPPVNTIYYNHTGKEERGDFFLVVSALVPYKKIDLAVKTFNKNGLPLKIVGTGPEMQYLKEIAKDNIEFIGWGTDEKIHTLYNQAKALIFPGEEDFGIVPLEATSCGCPVIAYNAGGAKETVLPGVNGVLFAEQSETSLQEGIDTLNKSTFILEKMQNHAESFSNENFKKNIENILAKTYNKNE